MSTTTDTTADVAERITALQDEREKLAAQDAADPLRAADSVDRWHARTEKRRQRTLEIERELRDLQEWGALIDTHPDAIAAYINVARRIAAEHRHLIKSRHYAGRRPTNPTGAVRNWLAAVQAFSRALPHSEENTRRVLARELSEWFQFRDAVGAAEAEYHSSNAPLPAPELTPDGLPPWIKWGIYRIDQTP